MKSEILNKNYAQEVRELKSEISQSQQQVYEAENLLKKQDYELKDEESLKESLVKEQLEAINQLGDEIQNLNLRIEELETENTDLSNRNIEVEGQVAELREEKQKIASDLTE